MLLGFGVSIISSGERQLSPKTMDMRIQRERFRGALFRAIAPGGNDSGTSHIKDARISSMRFLVASLLGSMGSAITQA